ncbi:MAG: hypothetical protein WCC64_01485 [Aliidongia sp.]|jgi:hypothetical protein
MGNSLCGGAKAHRGRETGTERRGTAPTRYRNHSVDAITEWPKSQKHDAPMTEYPIANRQNQHPTP